MTELPALGLLGLNVSRPTKERAAELLDWLWQRPEEVLVLSEVAPGSGSDLLYAVCRAAGYTLFDSRRDDYGVLVVARNLRGLSLTEAGLPDLPMLPGRILPLRLRGPGIDLTLVGVYGTASDPVRYSGKVSRERKRAWLAGLSTWLAEHATASTLLFGDLNVVAPGYAGRLPFVLAEESAFLAHWTAAPGWVDVLARDLPLDEVTWRDHTGVGCRFDHALASADLAPMVEQVAIVHEPRRAKLTDHSAITLTLTR